MRVSGREPVGGVFKQHVVRQHAPENRRVAIIRICREVEHARRGRTRAKLPRSRVDILERASANRLRAELHEQAVAAGIGRRNLDVVNVLRQVLRRSIRVLFVVPDALPAPAVPRVHVRRLVVAARHAHRRHDDEEVAGASKANVVHVAEDVRIAVVAQQAGATELVVYRRGERSRVEAGSKSSQPAFDPVAELMLRAGQHRRGAVRAPVLIEFRPELPQRRAQVHQRRGGRRLKRNRKQNNEHLHGDSV